MLVMYQIISSKHLRFGGINLSSNTVFQNSGIDCPTSGDSTCILDPYPAKLTNEDRSVVYILSSFKPTGVFFVSLQFNSLNVVKGDTFAASSNVKDHHSMNFISGTIYMMFETQDSKYVFTTYQPSSDSFTGEFYETSTSSKAAFLINSRYVLVGNSGQDIAFGS